MSTNYTEYNQIISRVEAKLYAQVSPNISLENQDNLRRATLLLEIFHCYRGTKEEQALLKEMIKNHLKPKTRHKELLWNIFGPYNTY